MTDGGDQRVLVPVDLFGGQGISRSLVETFASVPVVLLGYRAVPEQTPLGQARLEYGETARTKLAKHRQVFEAAGGDVTTRPVFTHHRLKTIERTAVALDCAAVLLLNPAPLVERVLVAIRGDVNVERITRLVGAVLADTTVAVTLFHVASGEHKRPAAEALLEDARASLRAAGVDGDRIECEVTVSGSPTSTILDVAIDYDLLVLGESRPSIRRFVFRDRAERLARRTVDPVLVIRGNYLSGTGTEAAGGGH